MSEHLIITPDQFGATGGIFRQFDPRDRSVLNAPGVAANLAAGPPPQYSTVPVKDYGYDSFDKAIKIQYDQAGEGSCVPNSEAGAKSIQDWLESGIWRKYDAREVWLAFGGYNGFGISTEQSLGFIRDVGFKDIASEQRFKLASYAFVPRVPNLFRESLAAMMQDGRPGVLAALLPSELGWNSNETPTSSYHQTAAIAYDGLRDDDHLIVLNSWPFLRFIRLTWRYIESNNFLNSYNYGYGLWDAKDIILPPPPPPPIMPVIKSIKVRKGGRKLVITGTFSADIVAMIDGVVIAPNAVDENWLRLTGLTPHRGVHQLIVSDDGAESAPFTFNVE